MAKILLVDDDTELLASVNQWLSMEDHTVESCTSGTNALELLDFSAFDVIVLDWTMPGLSGLDVCRAIRARGVETPILFLTGRSEIDDISFGLDSGADDYMTKPFNLNELSARVRALLRRFKSVQVGIIKFADLELDSKARRFTRAGEDIKLPPREFAILEFLMRHPNEIYSTEQLARQVWSSEAFATDQTVRTCIKRLRNYIDRAGSSSYISNVHGHGYGLNKEVS
jgi:DNA-binding response OmpR family regulator